MEVGGKVRIGGCATLIRPTIASADIVVVVVAVVIGFDYDYDNDNRFADTISLPAGPEDPYEGFAFSLELSTFSLVGWAPPTVRIGFLKGRGIAPEGLVVVVVVVVVIGTSDRSDSDC